MEYYVLLILYVYFAFVSKFFSKSHLHLHISKNEHINTGPISPGQDRDSAYVCIHTFFQYVYIYS